MSKAKIIKDEELIFIADGSKLRFICCDCGLAHDLCMGTINDEKTITIMVECNERSTAQVRRHIKKKRNKPDG